MTARRPRRTSFLSFAALASPVVVTMSVACKDGTRTSETDYSVCNAVCEVVTGGATEPVSGSGFEPTTEPASTTGTTGTTATTGTDPSSTSGTTSATDTGATTGTTTEDTSTAETTADTGSTTVDTTGETGSTGP